MYMYSDYICIRMNNYWENGGGYKETLEKALSGTKVVLFSLYISTVLDPKREYGMYVQETSRSSG